MNVPREQVRRAFDRARDYEGQARVQREVAARLAARIAALDLPPTPRVLEIGCGTGFLTAALFDAGLGGEWLVTDIAPRMIERCRAALGDRPGLSFALLDGEGGPLPTGPFDLICSSLAIQWFDDAPAALVGLAGILAPGGHLLATTLGPGTFAQWRAAHEAEGLVSGTPGFAPLEAFAALGPAALEVEEIVERFADPSAFPRAMKAIGAGTPDKAHRPLTLPQMRRVLAHLSRSGCEVTYQVVTCHFQRAR